MRHIFFHTTLDTLDGPDCITSLLERLALLGEVFVNELFDNVVEAVIDVKDVDDDIEVDVTSSERGTLPRSSIMALDCPITDSF